MRRSGVVRHPVAIILVLGLISFALPLSPLIARTDSEIQDPGGREEIISERTESSKTFRNPDGSLTTVAYTGPVHYSNDDGRWVDIDSELVESNRPGYSWRNKADRFTAHFKDELTDGYLLFTAGSEDFELTLLGSNRAPGGKGNGIGGGDPAATPSPTPAPSATPDPGGTEAPTSQPSPSASSPDPSDPEPDATPPGEESAPPYKRVSDHGDEPKDPGASEPSASNGSPGQARERSSRYTYRGAFENVDLRYDIVSGGVKESVIVRDARGPSSYRFLLDPETQEPIEASRRDDGGWDFFLAPHAGPLFSLDPPHESEGGRPVPPATDVVDIDVRSTGQGFLINLAVDARWLRDSERQFPIVIDPTITIQPTQEDATYSWQCSNCTPGGTWDRIYLGPGRDVNGGDQQYRGALKFDLSAVPAGTAVTEAKMMLFHDGFCYTVSCSSTSHQFDVHRMNKAWSATTTTANVGFDASPIASYTLPLNPGNRWMEWTITDTVKNWLTGVAPNYGVLVKRTPEPLASGGVGVPSKESIEPSVRPKLEITYSSDAVDLLPPDILHSNGAALRWTKFVGPSGAAFQKYEVHRSQMPSFTPSASSLLATINDVNVTTFRDTTAAPNRSFTYKIVANSSPSNEQTVSLPADGQASMTIQPDTAAGKATMFSKWTTLTNCANYGADDDLLVGTYSNATWRSLLEFDLRQIPTGAPIQSATMSLWHPFSVSTSATINAHRVTRAWREGTSATAACSHDGATWYEADGGVNWANQGGDFETTPTASVSATSGETSRWHNFNITSAAQKWSSGQAPNLGILLKTADETLGAGRDIVYLSDDQPTSSTLRPKLAVAYSDGSHAQGPTVAVTSPIAGSKVSGAVKVTASASDDRRVDQVEFLRNGVSMGVDTSAPYETTWNTTVANNGSYSFTARATDDAGNATTSQAITATVENSNPPAVSITAPAAAATVSGTNVTISANASDDFGVDRVEFFVDGNQVGAADTVSPYSVAWNTLGVVPPTYDGAHEVTARAYDSHGQLTIAAPVTVTVANTTGTKYRAGWTSSAVPPVMTYDSGAPQTYAVDVTAKNNSTTTWSGSDIVMRYRWFKQDGTAVSTSSDIAIASVNRGKSVTKRILVAPPILADGTDKGHFALGVDLFEKSTSTYFATKGNKPLENPVIVNKAIEATTLGLERYYH